MKYLMGIWLRRFIWKIFAIFIFTSALLMMDNCWQLCALLIWPRLVGRVIEYREKRQDGVAHRLFSFRNVFPKIVQLHLLGIVARSYGTHVSWGVSYIFPFLSLFFFYCPLVLLGAQLNANHQERVTWEHHAALGGLSSIKRMVDLLWF